MPNYTIYGASAVTWKPNNSSQACTGTGGREITGPPQGKHPLEACQGNAGGRDHFRWRGIYILQSANTYRWIRDERISDSGTVPTTWSA